MEPVCANKLVSVTVLREHQPVPRTGTKWSSRRPKRSSPGRN